MVDPVVIVGTVDPVVMEEAAAMEAEAVTKEVVIMMVGDIVTLTVQATQEAVVAMAARTTSAAWVEATVARTISEEEDFRKPKNASSAVRWATGQKIVQLNLRVGVAVATKDLRKMKMLHQLSTLEVLPASNVV